MSPEQQLRPVAVHRGLLSRLREQLYGVQEARQRHEEEDLDLLERYVLRWHYLYDYR